MSDVPRVSVEEARRKVQAGTALLVCAYDDDEKFAKLHLEGAIGYPEFLSRMPDLAKDHEVIFYCA